MASEEKIFEYFFFANLSFRLRTMATNQIQKSYAS